jgi:hypothetical protein
LKGKEEAVALYCELYDVAVEELLKSSQGEAVTPEDLITDLESVIELAMHVYPGCLSDNRLEEVVSRLSSLISSSIPTMPDCLEPRGQPYKVMHVDTCPSVGGHTECMLDWIKSDTGNQHDVYIRNAGDFLPDKFIASYDSGEIHDIFLGDQSKNRIEQVLDLFHAARCYHFVVLFNRSDDTVIAVAGSMLSKLGSSVIYFNHASHVSSIGSSTANVVVDFAEVNVEYSRQYLCCEKSLPLYFLDKYSEVSRTERFEANRLRKKFGIDQNVTTLVALGGENKFGKLDENIYLKDLHAFVKSHIDVQLVLALRNPRLVQQAGELYPHFHVVRSPSRLGVLVDLCDIYIDSMPLSGGHASFIFAAHGKPVLFGYDQELTPLPVAAFHCIPELPDKQLPRNKQEYYASLNALIFDPEYKERVCRELHERIKNRCSISAYREQLNVIYQSAQTQKSSPKPPVYKKSRPAKAIDGTYAQLTKYGSLEPKCLYMFTSVIKRRDVALLTLEWKVLRTFFPRSTKSLRVLLIHSLACLKRMTLFRAHV